MVSIEIPLIGPCGEPVDLRATINGHGVTGLPPMHADADACSLELTIVPSGHPPRSIRVEAGSPGYARVIARGEPPSSSELSSIEQIVRHVLRLDDDLSGFYEKAAVDSCLAWVCRGAGRFTRCQTVFEEIVKTILTTNCAWSATVRMTTALVELLGQPTPDGSGRAFPTSEAMAAQPEEFYRSAIRCGYRAPFLRSLAEAALATDCVFHEFGVATQDELSDDDLMKQLLALPGVGPYAAAHIMLMLGRYSRLVLDSWTRPTYAAAIGRESVPDAEIIERFEPYGEFAGLAFWLTVTRDWHVDDVPMGEVAH